MKVLVVAAKDYHPTVGMTIANLLCLLRGDGITCALITPLEPLGDAATLDGSPGTGRRKPSLKRRFRDVQIARIARNLKKGDVLLLLDPLAFARDAALLDLARTRRCRVVAVAGGRAEATDIVGQHLLRRYLTTLVVQDAWAASLARSAFTDVRIVTESSDYCDWYRGVRRALYPVINIYGIFYRFSDILDKTLAALYANTDIDFRLFIAENRAEESEHNREVVKGYMKQGLVHGYALFDENIYGSALEYLYRLFPPPCEDEIVIFSDLDLVIPAAHNDWLRVMLDRFQRFDEVATLSLDIDLCNWNRERAGGHKPVRKKHWSRKYGFYRFRSGVWFMGVRREIMDEYLDGERVLADNRYFRYLDAMYRRRVYGRLAIPCYHLSWDLEQTAPLYIVEKYERFYDKVYQRHPCPPFEMFKLCDDEVTAVRVDTGLEWLTHGEERRLGDGLP